MLEFISIVPGAEWPAIPDARASQLLAIQFQLERSQWLSADQLAIAQRGQLARVANHAANTVPFYRDRLAELQTTLGRPIDMVDWQHLPLLTRSDLQNAGALLRSTDVSQHHGQLSESVTSGSTGRPVRTCGTTLTRMMWNALTLRQHLWNERDLSKKFATIRDRNTLQEELSKTARAGTWGTATAGIVKTGPAVAIDIRTPIDAQAEWLIEEEPDYLLTYPSNAAALAQHFLDHQIRLQNLCQVRTFGETLDPRLRPLCKAAWQVPVVDNYSSQEVGYIALQCPESEVYHVQSESLLVEVIDDAGAACGPGQVGRVVVSTLQNFAMPLLRYEIGDYAEVGQGCGCRRGLPVLQRILGRQRNMFRLPSGKLIWPSLLLDGDAIPPAAASIRQYQIIQRTIDRLEVRVVAEDRLTESAELELSEWVGRSLGAQFTIDFIYVPSIARSVGGKFEDFRSEVI
jgi:phenylacetate-CoA ligase